MLYNIVIIGKDTDYFSVSFSLSNETCLVVFSMSKTCPQNEYKNTIGQLR